MMSSKTSTIAVVGAGPKGVAIAVKAQALRDAGVGEVEVVVIEGRDVAAGWSGTAGWTDGEVRLGTSPFKDIGFPYQSMFGAAVNERMHASSWTRYLMSEGRYASWVDRSTPQPHHREWAEYLRWAFARAGARLINAWLTDVQVDGDGLRLWTKSGDITQTFRADGLVLTGPGRALDLSELTDSKSDSILTGQSYWTKRAEFSDMHEGRIAVVGAGETAAAIVESLIDRPRIAVDIISRHGVLYTRGESYYENVLYSHPEQWPLVADKDRREFINRTDRGVFSVEAMRHIDRAENVRLVPGNITRMQPKGAQVDVTSAWLGTETTRRYDKVIVAVGFDPYTPLNMLSFAASDRYRAAGANIDYHLRLPQCCFPDIHQEVNIHVPMLAGFAQGPGFPNLSCLGRLSDRVLSHYLQPPKEDRDCHADCHKKICA